MVHFRAALGCVQSVRGAAPGARHGHLPLSMCTAKGSGTAHAAGSTETWSSGAAQVGWKLVISKTFHRSGSASRGRTHAEVRLGGRRHAALGPACMDITGRTCDGRNQISDSFLAARGCFRFTQPVQRSPLHILRPIPAQDPASWGSCASRDL